MSPMPDPSTPATSAEGETALIDAWIAGVMRHEGGLVDDPSDPGGLTNCGLSLAAFPELGADGIRAMTWERARPIYVERYWKPFRWRDLPAPIAVKAADAAVNMGGRETIKALQRACHAVHRVLDDDGALGDATVAAVNAAAADQLLAAFRSELAAHYRIIAALHPAEGKFLIGWLARAYE